MPGHCNGGHHATSPAACGEARLSSNGPSGGCAPRHFLRQSCISLPPYAACMSYTAYLSVVPVAANAWPVLFCTRIMNLHGGI